MKALLTFPWPPKALSPNARVHWSKKAKATAKYKDDCWRCGWVAMVQGQSLKARDTFRLVFCPPDNRRRDSDNMLASFKAGFDALSALTGVDDSKFQWSFSRGEVVKGGAVIVEVIE
jgi:crossover junction endodeoxyribonuclease RusA